MSKWFGELQERLLRAGVAPRHVRRYVTELREHWMDLAAEEERAGQSRAEAEAAALRRLGQMEDLARTMIERRELRSWTARAPWLVLGAGPVIGMTAGWVAALLILASGWKWFLQGSQTPFVPVHGFAIAYFGVGRMLYFTAPLLAGWAMVLLAVRQRVRTVWPAIIGSMIVALLGSAGAVTVQAPANAGEAGAVGIQFFSSPSRTGEILWHAAMLFIVVALPYLVWQWKSSRAELSRG